MPNGNTPRALVVDDVADAADMLTMLLRMWGYHTRVCYGGVAALELARIHRPHIVLLDIGMPGTDGFKVARGLREMAGMEGTVLIGISGYADECYRVRALASGFDHYLIKPEDPAHLKMLLNRSVSLTPSQDSGELMPLAAKVRHHCSRVEISDCGEHWPSAPPAATVEAKAPTSGRYIVRAGPAGDEEIENNADNEKEESSADSDVVHVNIEVGSREVD